MSLSQDFSSTISGHSEFGTNCIGLVHYLINFPSQISNYDHSLVIQLPSVIPITRIDVCLQGWPNEAKPTPPSEGYAVTEPSQKSILLQFFSRKTPTWQKVGVKR